MIEKENGVLVISCDSCSAQDESETDDWKDAWSSWKEEGWRSFKNGEDEWEHSCPACFEEWKKNR